MFWILKCLLNNFLKNRIHFQHLPDVLFHEKFDENLTESLKKKKN